MELQFACSDPCDRPSADEEHALRWDHEAAGPAGQRMCDETAPSAIPKNTKPSVMSSPEAGL